MTVDFELSTPATVVPLAIFGPVTDIPTVTPLVDGNFKTRRGAPDGAVEGSKGVAGTLVISGKERGVVLWLQGSVSEVGLTNEAIVPAGTYLVRCPGGFVSIVTEVSWTLTTFGLFVLKASGVFGSALKRYEPTEIPSVELNVKVVP